MRAAYLAYIEAGLAMFPVKPSRSDKKPLVSWSDMKNRPTTKHEASQWLKQFPNAWMGVACGAGSNQLFLIDFDVPGKHDLPEGEVGIAPAFEPWCELVINNLGQDLFDRLIIQTTAHGGRHILFRCDEQVPGSEKLAMRPIPGSHLMDELIETRGQGGYCMITPSPGYEIIQGDLANIPVLSLDELNDLLIASRHFDERVIDAPVPKATPKKPLAEGELMAGEHFDRDGTWEEILEPAGWTKVGMYSGCVLWRRPGKSHGWSARTGIGKTGDRMVCFTSSTVLPSMRSLTKYAVMAMLTQCSSTPDWGAAALELGKKGFGPQAYRKTPSKSVNEGVKAETAPAGQDEMMFPQKRKKSDGWQPGPDDYSDDEDDERASTVLRFSPTEWGNAERLVALYGRDLRYCHLWGKWVTWDGTRFLRDDTGGASVAQKAKAMVRGIAKDAWLVENEGRRGEMLEWCGKCHNRQKLENTIALARYEPGIPVVPGELDMHHDLLNVANGTVELRSSTLMPHDRKHLLTKCLDTAYNPDADCPTWTKFLARILDNDQDLMHYVWKALGYSLTGNWSEQKFFFCYGLGANGKSTLIETVMRILGEYATAAPPELLMVKHMESAVSNDIAMLKGARFVGTDETEDGKRLNESLVKRLTGGEQITARFLHQEHFTFDPTFKIWVSGNHKPRINGTDMGIWRRVVLIPFNVTIPDEERDKNLPEKLWQEREGILAWMIAGAKTWYADGLGTANTIEEAVTHYREESDTLGAFLNEHTSVFSDAKILSSILYERYTSWAKTNNEYMMSQKKFSLAMAERGEPSVKDREGRWFHGRELLANTAPQATGPQTRGLYDE